MCDVELARFVTLDDVLRQRLRIGEGDVLDMAHLMIVGDLGCVEPADHGAALLARQVEAHRLTGLLQLLRLAAGGTDDVGIKRAGKAALKQMLSEYQN